MSKIEWTGPNGETWNPTTGCSKAGEGCRNCYAIVTANIRRANPNPKIAGAYAGTVTADGKNWTGKVNYITERATLPLHWTKKSRICFLDSMSDLFHESLEDCYIDEIFAVMAICSLHANPVLRGHRFQLLTKRPARMREYLSDPELPERLTKHGAALMEDGDDWDACLSTQLQLPLPNVIAGFSAWDQPSFDAGWAELARTPLAARMVSLEPLLGPVDLRCALGDHPLESPAYAISKGQKLDWVIVGGESGPGARPMHPDWARGIRDQCVAAGVPYFFKQHGEFREWDARGPVTQVNNNSRRADLIERAATNPCWITYDGEVVHSREDFEEEVPYRMLERVGKKAAGRLLDGRVWDEMPGILQDGQDSQDRNPEHPVHPVEKGSAA